MAGRSATAAAIRWRVWVGNASGEGRPGLTGSAMAAPLMFALFNALPASPWFDLPDARTHVASTPAKTTATSRTMPAPRTAPGCRATVTSTRSVLTTCASTSTPRANNVWTATASRPAAMIQAQLVRAAAGRGVLLPPRARRISPDAGAARGLRGCADGSDVRRSRCSIRTPNRSVLIPQELDGSRGRTVFEAVHRRREATIYWHLDGQYLGRNAHFSPAVVGHRPRRAHTDCGG